MGMLRLVALIASVITSACTMPAGTATPDPAAGPGEIAFRLGGAGGAAIVVPVSLNGKGPYDFVLDTGATLTCLDESLAEELSLARVPGVIGRGATLGSSGPVGLRRLDSISIGEARSTDVTVCTLDLANIRAMGLEVRGLLGLNVLKAYTVTLDFKRNVLSLQP
ncbi:MAG: retropepsin-like aspartic protease [Vicinamibacterales bacterium]